MTSIFNFCSGSLVAETLPPEPLTGVSMNGWQFVSKPAVPYQRKFRVTLHGLQWFLANDGSYDLIKNPTRSARLLELFYQARQTWDNFTWVHPHLGALTVRFAEPLTVPMGKENAGGVLDPLEVTLIEHQPGYS